MSIHDLKKNKWPSVAFLIDADNFSSGGIEDAFEHLRQAEATVQVRRAYGGLEKLAGLKDVLRRHAVQGFVNQGKGTTDVALVVDAMDLLHRGGLPSIVAIGSSDADFAPLAVRLREAGMLVICFAQKLISSETLPLAYDKVIFVDAKSISAAAPTAALPAKAPQVKEASPVTSVPATIVTGRGKAGLTKSESASAPPLKSKLFPAVPAASAADEGALAVRKIIAAIPGWLPNTIKQLNQLGAPLVAGGIKKGSKPLHELFRKYPAFFKVLPTTGPAKQVRLLKLP
jgi:hypothetical protein